VPINVDAQKTELLAASFGCIVGSFPFTYLGLPLGLTKPLIRDFAPLICIVERRLTASSQFLSYAGRLQLINSVLSSLPTYYMCSLKLPVTVIDVIDKYRKNCLWRGKEFNQKKYNLAASDLVRRPKSKGGLSVVNLSVQNNALLLKQLDKFYRKADVQWVRLIWQKYLRMQSLIWLEKMGHFGGRTFSDYMFCIEELQSACLPGEILLLSGRILSMELCNLSPSQTLLAMQKTRRLPFGSLQMKAISLTASIFPCLELHTMNTSFYSSTLIHFHPLTFARKTLGSSFGGSKFTLPVNTICINSNT
jgi:hypothetical protein